MLILTLSTTSLLILSRLLLMPWSYTIPTLVIITMISITMFQYPALTSVRSVSIHDRLRTALICLSIWVTLLIILARFKIHTSNTNLSLFVGCCYLLLITLILCFSATRLLIFYIWFEASLVPTILLIILWGYQPERAQASIYLIVYTVVARLPLLLTLLLIYYTNRHISITYPWTEFPTNINSHAGSLILLSAFLVKLPLFSVHLWLPKAHVEAPVAGSIILAAILLKLGGYGLVRISLMLPKQVMPLCSPLIAISLVGAAITGLICLRQSDMKSLIAYSSVGHIGLLIGGVASFTEWGIKGALAIIVAHGLTSSGLFCLANITYEISHTRSLTLTKGLLFSMPIIALIWFLILSANIAAPPTINLLREIILITSLISKNLTLIVCIGAISFVRAAYSLFLYSTLNHGGLITTSNTNPVICSRYYVLILIHLSPTILLITAPVLITTI